MEEKVKIIGVRKLHSKKTNKDIYIVDYIDKNNKPETDFINEEEYKNIEKKMKPLVEQIGIYGINSYKKAYLKDIK